MPCSSTMPRGEQLTHRRFTSYAISRFHGSYQTDVVCHSESEAALVSLARTPAVPAKISTLISLEDRNTKRPNGKSEAYSRYMYTKDAKRNVTRTRFEPEMQC